MKNLTVALETRYAHLDDVCLVCSGPMYKTQNEVDWFNKMIGNKTENFSARTKCSACKAKRQEAINTLPTAPVTYQVKPGVTVTKQMPVVSEAPPQTVKAPDYAGGGYEPGKHVYLKPSVLDTLRATPFHLNKSSLARILGITPLTITKWCREGKLPRCPGRDKSRPGGSRRMSRKAPRALGSGVGTPGPDMCRLHPARETGTKAGAHGGCCGSRTDRQYSPRPGHVEACGHRSGTRQPQVDDPTRHGNPCPLRRSSADTGNAQVVDGGVSV